MKPRTQAAFSIWEVLVALVISFILILVVAPYIALPTRSPGGGQRIKCISNLKNAGLAARIFAIDNNGLFPPRNLLSNRTDVASITVLGYFLLLSNELSTPKIIICPTDRERTESESFTNLSVKNISYFASLTAEEHIPLTFLFGDRNIMIDGIPVPPGRVTISTNQDLGWSKTMHVEQGHVAMGDGSVQQFSSSRLSQAMRDHQPSTNMLLIP